MLTGAPVAGCVYLDRPAPAGYFIFPDLSVRHEGVYRLSFSLYEDVKEEKDEDPMSSNGPTLLKENNAQPHRQKVYFRLDVRSEAFSVFSAKKFPGLAESTGLSRTVAEQGCRVRIRREVRLRRRDKQSDNYQNACEEGQYAPSDRYSTPHYMSERPRSISNTSMEPPTPYSVGRRPSMHESQYYAPATYPPAPPPPALMHAPPQQPSHLNFGNPSAQGFQKPNIPGPPPLPTPQPYTAPVQYPSYPTPPQQNAHTAFNYHDSNYGHGISQQASYGNLHSYMEGRNGGSENLQPLASPALDTPHRKQEQPQYQMQAPSVQRPLTPLNTDVQSYQSNEVPKLPPVTSLLQSTPEDRPSEPVSADGAPQGPQNPFSATNLASYATTSSSMTPHPVTAPYSSEPLSGRGPYLANREPALHSSKRSYGNVFDVSHMDQPQHSGARPHLESYAQDIPKIETDDGDFTEYVDNKVFLSYKRANGEQHVRKCPSPRDRQVIDYRHRVSHD